RTRPESSSRLRKDHCKPVTIARSSKPGTDHARTPALPSEGEQLRKSIGDHPVASFLAITFAWGWMFYVPAAFVIDDRPEQTWLLVALQTAGAAAPLLAGHVVRQVCGGWSSVA